MEYLVKRARGLSSVLLTLSLAACLGLLFSGCEEKLSSFVQKGSGSSTGSDFFKPEDNDIVIDQGTGLKVVKNVLNITFSPKTSKQTIDRIIKSINGEIVGYDYSVNFYQVRIGASSPDKVDKIRLGLIGGFKEVEMASRTPVSAHKNPYYIK